MRRDFIANFCSTFIGRALLYRICALYRERENGSCDAPSCTAGLRDHTPRRVLVTVDTHHTQVPPEEAIQTTPKHISDTPPEFILTTTSSPTVEDILKRSSGLHICYFVRQRTAQTGGLCKQHRALREERSQTDAQFFQVRFHVKDEGRCRYHGYTHVYCCVGERVCSACRAPVWSECRHNRRGKQDARASGCAWNSIWAVHVVRC